MDWILVDITFGIIPYAISIDPFSCTGTIALHEKKNVHIIFIQPEVLKILTVNYTIIANIFALTIHIDFNKIF